MGHCAQILAFHKLLQDHPEHAVASNGYQKAELILIGGIRNETDEGLREMKQLVKQLGIVVS